MIGDGVNHLVRRCLVAVLFVGMIPAAAAGQSDDFTLTSFRGGELEASVQLGLNLAGVGTGSGTFGGVLSAQVNDGASGLFNNPANLGGLSAPQWAFGSRAGFGTNTLGLDGTNIFSPSDVETETDDVLNELSYPENQSPTYTTVQDIDLGLQSQLSSFAAAFPVTDRLTLGMGLRRSVDLRLRTRASGIETQFEADQETGGQTINIDFLTRLYGSANAQINVTSLNFGAGSRLFDNKYGRLSLGVALHRHYATHQIRVEVQPQSMILLNNSQEFFFNKSDDPNLTQDETNRFFWRAKADYEDRAWSFRGGLQYQLPFEWLTFSAAYSAAPDLRMTDSNAFSRRYLPQFVDLTPPEGEDRVNVDDLSLAKPNLTTAVQDSLGTSLNLNLPSTLTLGVDFGLGKHAFSVNYMQYFGDFSYRGLYSRDGSENDPFQLGKDPTYGLRYGMNFTFPNKLEGAAWALLPIRLLYLDIDGLLFQAFRQHTGYRSPQYRIGGGVMFGDEIADEDRSSGVRNALSGPLPTGFALGREYTVFHSVDVGVMLLGFPDTAFRVGLAYTMP